MHLPWTDLADQEWLLEDRLSGIKFDRAGDELGSEGLYVALEPWASHFLALTPHPVGVMSAAAGAETVSA